LDRSGLQLAEIKERAEHELGQAYYVAITFATLAMVYRGFAGLVASGHID
jgi:hypothetical protein